MKVYQNREWLYNKYVIERLSMLYIAKLCRVSDVTILYWLRKYGIPTRSRAEVAHLAVANYCNLSQKALEWINGELLGDGNLSSCSPYSAYFQYSSKYLKYIQYVKNTFKFFGIGGSRMYKCYSKSKDCYFYSYKSLSYAELLPIRKQWYPEGKKIVPKDTRLTPLTCRQWHIGDGCLVEKGRRRPSIKLHTTGFSIPDVNWLIDQLFNLGLKVTRHLSSNCIYISTYSTEAFLNYIGKCPVECYQYKFSLNK